MNKQMKFIKSFLFFTLFYMVGFGKNKLHNFFEKRATSIVVQHAGVGMPLHGINGRFQPGFELGIEKLKSRKHFISLQYTFGYMAQRSLQRSFYLKPSLGYNYFVFKNKLKIKPHLDFAIMLTRQTNKEFKLENGRYERVNPLRFQVMPTAGLDVGLPIKKNNHKQYSLLAGYAFGIQLPFSELSTILPINQFRIGLQIHTIQ